MRMLALRREAPKIAPSPEPAVNQKPALRRLSPIPISPSSTDYDPPPIRLGRVDSSTTLDRSGDLAQPINLSSLAVSSPHDPAEKEATATAGKIVRMGARPDSVSYVNKGTGGVFRLLKSPVLRQPLEIKHRAQTVTRSALTVPLIERQPIEATIQTARSSSTASSRVAANIKASMPGGEPLPIGVRRFMEPRFGADFSTVRIHTSGKAAVLNRQLRARAFTTRNHIFFGADRFKPETVEGKELIAHELTHTIQQGGAVQRDGVHRSEEPGVSEREPSKVQRLFDIPNPLDWLAEKATSIPGFRMLTIILGVNPINMTGVDRSAANILRALIEVMPGGSLITQALDNHGVFDKVGAWVEKQVDALGMTGAAIKQAVDQFIDSLDLPGDILHPGATWERAKRIFTDPIDQLKAFAEGVVSGIIEIIKDAILKPIAELAEGTEGYNLLKGVLGKDPITGEAVAPTADTLLGPFMKIIGQGEIWENMKKANAIPRCWAWFQSTMSELMGFVSAIPDLFITALKSLEIEDIILVPRAFAKLASVFGSFLGDFVSWGLNAIWNLLEIIFEVVKPGALGYVKKTGAALKSILKNPLPFVGNLAKAAKLGFQNFGSNFVTHLKAGLIDWLTGSLRGVYIPKAFSLPEIVKFVFSVLGLSWANVRQKLVKVVGEPVVKAMETGFDIVVTLVTQGPAAAWDKIKDQLTNLKDMVIQGIIGLVVDAVVKKAIPKLIAMFIPGAGFISAIISIYDIVMVFVNKISRIIQVVNAFISSIVAIAAGNIGAAAGKVESILAGLLALAINFLAGFAGLGKIADKIMGVINKVRGYIDKALDKLIGWIVTMAKKLFVKKDKKPSEMSGEEKLAAAIAAANQALISPNATVESIREQLPGIRSRFGLKVLNLVVDGEGEEDFTAHVHGELNPRGDTARKKVPKSAKTTKVGPIQIPRDKMKWKSKTKKELARRFVAAGGPASAVEVSTGKIRTKKKYGRRHIVSFSDMKTHYEAAFPPKTVEQACKVLAKFGIDAQYTKKSVHSKVRSLAKQAFNFVDNLWIGLQSDNSALQEQVDPSPEMLDRAHKVVQKKLDAHIEAFLVKWGVPGTPFGITTDAGVIDWEIQEV